MEALSWSNPWEKTYSGTQQLISEVLGQIKQGYPRINNCIHYWIRLLQELATVGLLQGGITCRLCGKALESAKHILLKCELLDIRRRRIFEGWQIGQDVYSALEFNIVEVVKFTGGGRPLPEQ